MAFNKQISGMNVRVSALKFFLVKVIPPVMLLVCSMETSESPQNNISIQIHRTR